MLQAQAAASVLERRLATTEMLAYAILSTDGIVLESREQRTKPTDLFPQHAETSENFQVSSKLQTKIYALFVAEHWRQDQEADWLGAEAHERRLVVRAILDRSALVLVVGHNTQPWGLISENAREAAEELVQSASK